MELIPVNVDPILEYRFNNLEDSNDQLLKTNTGFGTHSDRRGAASSDRSPDHRRPIRERFEETWNIAVHKIWENRQSTNRRSSKKRSDLDYSSGLLNDKQNVSLLPSKSPRAAIQRHRNPSWAPAHEKYIAGPDQVSRSHATMKLRIGFCSAGPSPLPAEREFEGEYAGNGASVSSEPSNPHVSTVDRPQDE
jgi:hypothetical protein